MKNKMETNIIQIFPEKDKGDEWKTQDHKWCVLITKKNIAEGLKEYLKQFSQKRLIHFNGNKAIEKFKAPEGSLMNKIIACQIDNCTLSMNSIKYKNGTEVFFLWTGMSFKEVDKYYEKFLRQLRKLKRGKK